MRKNKLIALLGTLTMAAAGLAGICSTQNEAESVSAATETTVYCAISPNTIGNKTLKVKYRDGGNSWDPEYQVTMTGMDATYHGKRIYSRTFTDSWDGVSLLQFQVYNVDTWEQEKTPFNSWTSVSTYNNKLYNYDETSWNTYGTDSWFLVGSFNSWSETDPIEYYSYDGTNKYTQYIIDDVCFNEGDTFKFKNSLTNDWIGYGGVTFENYSDYFENDDSGNIKVKSGHNLKTKIYFKVCDSTYKVWFEAKTFTLTANSSDSSKGTVSASKTTGISYKENVTITASANSGYNFVKWNDNDTNASRTVCVTDDVTYTAYFAADTYSVAFHPGDGSGTMDPIVTEVGTATTVPSCGFTAPSKKKFSHWLGSDSNTYNPGGTIASLAKDATLTLTAIWKDYDITDGYYIEFDGARSRIPLIYNGGSTVESSQWIATGISLAVDEKFKIANYVDEVAIEEYGTTHAYAGGAVTHGQIGTDNDYFKVNFDGDYDFYFHDLYDAYKIWIPAITYTITYKVNGGTAASGDYVIHPNCNNTFITENISKAGFTAPSGKAFKEWNTSSDGTGTPYAVGDTVTGSDAYTQNSNHDLYAIWEDAVANGTYLRGDFQTTAFAKDGQLTMTTNPDNDHEQMIKGVALEANDRIKVITYTDNVGTYHNAQSTSINGTGYSTSIDGDGNAVIDKRGVFNIYVNTYSEDKNPWSYNYYALRIRYNANGGSGEMSSSYPTAEGYLATVSANSFTAPSGKRFTGWNTVAGGTGTPYSADDTIDFSEKTEDVTLYAQWEDVTYNVTLAVNNNAYGSISPSQTVTVPSGTVITSSGNVLTVGSTNVTATPSAATAQYNYSFSNWSSSTGSWTVSSDMTVTANFSATTRSYTVVWKNYDGTVLETDNNVSYGATPTYNGSTPTKPSTAEFSYSFTGWSPEISSVTGDAEYVAQFSSTTRSYTVVWKNYDGTVLETDNNVSYGATPTYNGSTPTKPSTAEFSYSFTGWSPEISSVTGDAEYVAQFSSTTRSYTVIWKNYDGTVLETDNNVSYGATPSYDGTIPTKPSTESIDYTFTGWNPEISSVTGDAEYVAQFSESTRQYTIKFVNYDGTELQSSKVAYGTTPSYTGETPTKPDDSTYSYTFKEWSPAIVAVSGEATYTATFTATKLPSVEASEFASAFLTKMSETCNVEGGTSPSALKDAWSLMESNFSSLSPAAKVLLKEATAVPKSESNIEKFASSYDYIYGKYSVSAGLYDFADRDPSVSTSSKLININDVSTSTWIIAAVAIVGVAAVGVFFIYRKRKEN